MQTICKTESQLALFFSFPLGSEWGLFSMKKSVPPWVHEAGVRQYLKWESGDLGVGGENRSLRSGNSRTIKERLTCPKQSPPLCSQEMGGWGASSKGPSSFSKGSPNPHNLSFPLTAQAFSPCLPCLPASLQLAGCLLGDCCHRNQAQKDAAGPRKEMHSCAVSSEPYVPAPT